MRPRDVQIGETYLVEVPHRLSRGRYPIDALTPNTWWQLNWFRGCRFRLTVTELDTEATPPMVEGIRIVHRSFVRLDLTADQITDLGLPAGVYHVQGVLYDLNHKPVALPEMDTLRLPTRWLYPTDRERPRYSHRDLDQEPW